MADEEGSMEGVDVYGCKSDVVRWGGAWGTLDGSASL